VPLTHSQLWEEVMPDELIPSDWVNHDGGQCPIDPYSFVEVRFMGGGNSIAPAFHWVDRWSNRWEHVGPFSSEFIVAYRPYHSIGGSDGTD